MKTQVYESWILALQKAENTLNVYRDGIIMSDIITCITDFRNALHMFVTSPCSFVKREDAYGLMLTAFGRFSAYLFYYQLEFWAHGYLDIQKTFMAQILVRLAVK